MDWTTAITAKQEALARIVATLIAMLGLAGDGGAARLPQPLYRAVLRVLRPAESAVRRLIVVAAHGLKVELAPPRPPRPKGKVQSGAGNRCPAFPLFDPPHRLSRVRRKRAHAKAEPRIHLFVDGSLVSSSPPQPAKRPAPEDGSVSAARLARRLAAVKLALDSLPRQAKRLARWRARSAKLQPPTLKSPIRPGPPPGFRQKPRQEIDWLLWECHVLAVDALAEDTS